MQLFEPTNLIPTKVIPDKRQVVGNLKRAIFIEESQFTAAPWSSS